jgi:hypothetical protein
MYSLLHGFIRQLADFPRYRSYFACSQCLKLRFQGAFADKQVKAKRGKGHAESDRRFCVDCGVKKRIYQPGQKVIVNGKTRYVCGLCRSLFSLGFSCWRCGCVACQRCLQREAPIVPVKLDHGVQNCHRCSYLSFMHLSESEEPTFNHRMTFPTPQDPFLSFKMADFQEDYGMMDIPEW